MRFNEAGELNPFEIRKGCPRSCNLCLRSCPFSKQASDEDEIARPWYGNERLIKHTGETGYYLESYVGYSNVNDHRVKGASGGLLTWTLESLLKQGMVDEVICVAPRSGGHPLFEFSACRSPEAIRSCSRSCYYPVEISKIIKTILTIDSRYAVVALPCVCKALRLAMGNLPILRKRIKYLLGLVCGQNKSRFFPEYICALAGGNPGNMDRVAFRMKSPDRTASSSAGIWFRCVEGNQVELEKTVYWTEGTDRIWLDRYFTPLACDFCDDVFAECADAAFMDAWLPEYSSDWRGFSIALLRREDIAELYRTRGAMECKLQSIPIGKVIHSQGGVLNDKRRHLRLRIALAARANIDIPGKRLHLYPKGMQMGTGALVASKWNISRQSGRVWRECNGDIHRFHEEIHPLKLEAAKANRRMTYFRYPNAAFRRIAP